MNVTWGLLLAGALALAACADTGTATAPAPESAGAAGPGYCDSPPADPDALENWNQLCMPDR
jgi:hypothetical protein